MTDTKIENLRLSTMTYNALKNAGITDLAQLSNMYEWQIENIRTIGQQTMAVIHAYMERFNIHFKEDEEEEVPEPPKTVSPTVLENMTLSPRSYNALKRHGIDDLQELSEMELCEFKRIRNLGETSMKEVMLCMCTHNIYFKGCTKEEMNSYKFWDNVCREKKREQECPGQYLDLTDAARKSKARREAAKNKATEEETVEVLDEESFWEACSRELSDLIMAGYTIEDVCDELSITPSTFDLINQLAPIRKSTKDILKELKVIDKFLEGINPDEGGNKVIKGEQLRLMSEHLVSLGDMQVYSKDCAVSWTPEEDVVLRYLEKRGLSATSIQLLFPRTKTSIVQRYRKFRMGDKINYRSNNDPYTQQNRRRSIKLEKIKNDTKRGIYNMANINDLLTQLSDEIITAASDGKSVDEIAKELGVDKNWIDIIFNNVMGDEAKVLEVIKNDTHFKILTKNDLAEITGISVPNLNVICANLLKFGKVSYATLWKRELLPSSAADWKGKEEQIVEWCKQGINRDIICYMVRSNPSAFRKSLTQFSRKYDIPKYIEMETQNRAAGRNSRFVQLVTLMEYHLPDLCKGLSDDSVEIITNNFKRLKEDLTEPIPLANEPSETTESNIDNDFDDSFDDVKETYEQMEFCDEPVVTAEPQEDTSVEDVVDEHDTEFVDILNESVLEAVKDPADITEYHGLVEHEDTDEIGESGNQPDEPKPKRERPEWLRRKDEWTDRELEILKSMVLNGDTPYEISRHPDMHRSLAAIQVKIGKLRANGELPKKQKKTKEKKNTRSEWTTTEEAKLIQMHLAGSKVSDIAKALGRSKGSVGVRIHKLRSEARLPQGDPEISSRFKPVWTDEETETIKRMIKEGHSIKDILPHLPNKKRSQVDNKIADMKRTGKL